MEMDFLVLGPLEVRDGDRVIEVRGPKRRALLALLAVHANEVIRADRLIEEVWGGNPPANTAAALQNHISRLRKELGSDVLVTKPWGYVLRTEPEAVDLFRFERLVVEAQPLAANERKAMLGEALSLWRGPALADLADEPALSVEIARLEELRLAAVEQRIDAELELGGHETLIPELETLVAQEPLRERFRGQLILALYRSGRQAEALETFRETRRVLIEELGIEPSPELRELERAILRQDPSLVAAPVDSIVKDEPLGVAQRWHWPRSPLVAAAVLLALASVGGALTALIATRNGDTARPNPVAAAAAAVTTNTTPGTKSSPIATTTPPHTKPQTKAKIAGTHHTTTTVRARRPARKAVARPRTKTQKTTVGTHPARSHQTRAAPQQRVRVVDTFSGGTINSRIWEAGAMGTGVEVAQRNGRLELLMHKEATPDPTWNAMSGQYTTACSFTGDFDARIEYSLLEWPASSGAVAGLQAQFPDDNVHILRKTLDGTETYEFNAPSGEFRALATSDQSGGFRLARVGRLITSYYRVGKTWRIFATARRVGPVRIEPILWASGSNFAHADVAVAFDNFSLLVPSTACS